MKIRIFEIQLIYNIIHFMLQTVKYRNIKLSMQMIIVNKYYV